MSAAAVRIQSNLLTDRVAALFSVWSPSGLRRLLADENAIRLVGAVNHRSVQ